MQIQSDILGVYVVKPKVAETSALGAAYLAGLAIDFWSLERSADIGTGTEIFAPIFPGSRHKRK